MPKETASNSLAQKICLDLLITGKVRSFSDFFHMVLEKSSQINENDSDKLVNLKKLLTCAENNQRTGNAKAVYKATTDISNFFESIGEYGLAVKYSRDAKEVAKLLPANEVATELDALINYGCILEHAGEPEEALENFNNARKLSKKCNNQEIELKSTKSVIGSRIKISENLEKEGKFEESIQHYQQCMHVLSELASLTEADKTTLCEMNFRLGRAFHNTGDLTSSTKHLVQYLDGCKKSGGDKSREGEAKVYLASCYEKAGNLELAATHLQQYIAAAEKDLFQRNETSTACKQLGNLFGKLNNHKESVVNYEKHYAITTELLAEANAAHVKLLSTPASNDNQQTIKKHANSLKNQELLVRECSEKAELARILLGIARGNSQMANLFGMVGDNLFGVQDLISWKSGANGIKPVAPEIEDAHDFPAIEFQQQQQKLIV